MWTGGEDFPSQDDAGPSTGGQQQLMTEEGKKTLLGTPASTELIYICVRRLKDKGEEVTAGSVLNV